MSGTVVKEFDERYNEAYYAWDPFYPEAERDLRFYLGDQWDEQEKRDLFQEGRSTFVFNKVRRGINMISGYQRKHRLSSVVIPIENSDQQTADQFSKLMLYVMNQGDGYNVISDCFSGALKTGWNLATVWMDYRDDPINGDIRFGREPYNGFICDPYLTNLDLSDCQYLIRRKYLGPEQVASLLPGHEKDILDLYRLGWSRDDKFTWLPYQRQPNGQEMMAYNEDYVQKWKSVPVLVDRETGETLEFDLDRESRQMFLQRYPQLAEIKQQKRYIEKRVIVNDVHIKTEVNPYGLDEYPFVPFATVFESESDQWGLKVQSAIRCIRDPQREANRRRSQMIDILDSQINSGWVAKKDSVINPRSLFQSSQGKVVWLHDDAPRFALNRIEPAQVAPSMFQLQELFDRDVMEILGTNDAAFGQTENAGESGVMMMLRQGAAIINLQEVFDRLRLSQKTLSRKVLKLMQQWSPQKIQRIINEEPSQQFYDKEFTKYDVDVQEGILTDTQRQMHFRQLIDLKQLGAPVTAQMLAEAAPIQGKTEYIAQLAQMEQQQAQEAAKQAEIEQQLLDSQRQQAQARAIADIAHSKERFTRAVANMGLEDERASEAVENRADSALKRAKAMKELETIDDDRLVKYLGIIRMMEEINQREENETKADDVVISEQANEPPSRSPEMIPQATEFLQELPPQQGELPPGGAGEIQE